jgi:hypothetical protein
MPFLNENEITSKGQMMGINPDVNYTPEFWNDTVPEAYRMWNNVASARANVSSMSKEPFNKNYDPISNLSPEYAMEANQFAFSNSDYEVETIKKQIDREREDRVNLSAGGYPAMAASIVAGITDPLAWVPVGGVAWKTYREGGSILKNALTTARVGALSISAQEAGLHQSQYTRTWGESAANIAVGTMLSGILGGSLGFVREALAKQGKSLEDIAKGIEMEFNVDSVGAARAATTTLSEEGLQVPNKAMQAVLAVTKQQDPILRGLTRKSKLVREMTQEIAEVPLIIGKNTEGIATPRSIYANVRTYQKMLYNALVYKDDQYVQYIKGRSKKFGDIVGIGAAKLAGKYSNKFSQKEFNIEVGKAMRRGNEHSIPEVSNTAKYFSDNLYKPILDEAVNLGLLPEGVMPETAIGYLNRVYNLPRLARQPYRQNFINKTVTYFKERQQDAAGRAAPFEEEIKTIKNDISVSKGEIRSISNSIFDVSYKSAKDEANKRINEALTLLDQRLVELRSAPKTDEQIKNFAELSSRSSYLRKLGKQVSEDIEQEVKATADETGALVIKEITEEIENSNDAELMALIKEIPPPIAKDVSDVAANLGREAIESAKIEAMGNAQKAFAKAIKNQLEMRANETPEDSIIRALKEIRQSVATESRKAASVAARKATKDIREHLHKKVKELIERRKQNVKDLFSINTEEQEFFDTAEQLVSRIEGIPGGRLPYDMTIPGSGKKGQRNIMTAKPLHERVFLIDDAIIEEDLESDIETLAKIYTRSMAPDIEIARWQKTNHAPVDFEFKMERDAIRREYEQMIRKASGKEAEALGKERDAAIEDILAMLDQMRGVYGLPHDPKSWAYRAGRSIKELNFVRMMGGVTLTSLPDIAQPVMVHGFTRLFKHALIPMIRNFKTFKLDAKTRSRLGAATDMVMNSRAKSLADIQDEFGRYSVPERILGAISDTFGMVSLNAPWNTAMKQIAGAVSQGRLLKNVLDEVAGVISKEESTYLRAASISVEDSKLIAEQLKKHGSEESGLLLSNATEWDRTPQGKKALLAFETALLRDVERTILTPGLDVPLTARGKHGVLGQLILQFKAFIFASTQRMLLMNLQKADAATLNGLWLSISLGMLSYAVKSWDAGHELSDDPVQWLKEGVDRSGVTSWFFEVNNIAEKASRGSIGLSRIVGGKPISRYASRNVVSALLGPSFGTASSIVGAAGNISAALIGEDIPENEMNQSDIHTIRTLFPYNNLSGFRQLVDHAEKSINEHFGIQK